MDRIAFDDVLNIYEYEKERTERRRKVMATKARRRVQVGDRVSFVFENRETVLNQIHEMMRAERIVDDEKTREEIDVYNELIPEDGALSTTMFIEIPELKIIQRELDRLLGIDGCVTIEVGEHSIKGLFDPRQSREDRISAVHYIKFPFPPGAVNGLRGGATARIAIHHEHYRASADLSEALRHELLQDLGT